MSYKYVCYLAGPITGCSFDNASDWREDVKGKLDPSIAGMSPLRGKKYLAQESNILHSYEGIALSSAKGITARDFNDCRRSDAVLVNFLGAETVSIGTVMEIAWAKAFNIPTVLVMEEDSVHNHAMIRESVGFIVDTLEEGVHIINSLLIPDPVLRVEYEDHIEKALADTRPMVSQSGANNRIQTILDSK